MRRATNFRVTVCRRDGVRCSDPIKPLFRRVYFAIIAGCLSFVFAARPFGARGDDPPAQQTEPTAPRSPLQAEPPPGRPPIVLPGPFRLPGQVDDDAPSRPPLSVDRQSLRELQGATDAQAKKNYPEAIRQLQRVLDEPEDSWLESAGGRNARFRSAKQQAADRIGQLPPSVRESYENEYGQTARRMFEDATTRGDRAGLEEVVRRFFHTQAGYEAAYQLANRLMDDSQLLAAEGHFERLRVSPGGRRFEPMLSLKDAYCCLQSGLAEKASQILTELKPVAAGSSVKIAGRTVVVPEGDSKDLQWLASVIGPTRSAAQPASDWLMTGGNPSRTAEGAPALPLGEPTWTQSVIRDAGFFGKNRFDHVESVLQTFERELGDHNGLTIPVADPLVVGNTAIFRTLARLRAVDLRTGARLWDFLECDRVYHVLATADHQSRLANRLPINLEVNEPGADLRLFLSARSFRDRSYGSLSSDGQRVFVLLDMGFLGLEEFRANPQQNELLGARNQNVLAAVDLSTGEIQWEIGGTRADRKNRDHAGTFFLGSGLPLESALYCLGELDGEISLFKLDPSTGKTAWAQRLAVPLGRLPHFPLRRLAGDNPSYASGLLVCPTSAGVVAAVDPSSRTLRWEYRYRINVAEDLPDPRMLWADEPLYTGIDETARWLDSAPVIAEQSVLLTPRDSNELHCINLGDGTPRWKTDRGNRLFIAAVLDGTVVVVGRSSIEALRLSDGSPVWPEPISISSPAGRGYRNGPLYHLPLASSELATIDLRRGRMITRSRFPAGVKPGNLVAADGAVVMQSSTVVQGFRPTAELERSLVATLAQHPDDAASLAVRGELRLDRGQTAQGMDDLFRSLSQKPERHADDLAVATVLEGLRYDFANSHKEAPRIAAMIADPAQRFEFHRLMARGLEQSGDFTAALDHEIRLIDDETLAKTLVSVGESTRVQPAAVVAPDLGELYRKAPDAQKAELRNKIEQWAGALAAAGKIDQLTRAVGSLRELPEDIGLRRSLAETLSPENDQAEIVRQLTHLRDSDDAAAAGYATARLARLMIDHGRAQEALPLLGALEEKYARVACSKAKTGAELARAWRSERAVTVALNRLALWPAGNLAMKRRDEDRATRAVMTVPVDQRSGPYFRQWKFESRAHGGGHGPTLIAFDETGSERWQFELENVHPRAGHLGVAAVMDPPVAIRVHGPLLEVQMHRRFAVLDGFDGHSPPKLLWTAPLYDPSWTLAQSRSEISIAGLMTNDFVFSQIGSVLRCADAVGGNLVWERRNVPTSFLLQGDEDYVLAVARGEPNDLSGLVLRTATGTEVLSGSFNIPGPLPNEWKGRRVLLTSAGPVHLSLSMMEIVPRARPAWSKTYAMPAWTTAIDDEEFAVVDSKGMVHVHSFESGNRIVEAEIERPGSPSQVMVRRVGRRYIILSQGSGVRFPGFRDVPHGNPSGKIWAIDRESGKTDWSISMPASQILIDTPADSPVLVLLHPPTRRSESAQAGEGSLSLIDARSGALLYDTAETTPPDRISVRLDRDARQVTVSTDKCVLTISAANGASTVPASSKSAASPAPVRAPRPAPRP
jgi:outer membrane protein assembly factor BamB/predicted negative regulator of RcsB-dependent stress response